MAKRHFFKQPAGLTVGEIAALTGATPRDGTKLDRVITDIAPLDLAGPDDLTFFDNARYKDDLRATKAGVCLIAERFEHEAPAGLVLLRAKEPYRAFVVVAGKLFPQALRPSSSFDAVTSSATASTAGCAFATATPWPAQATIPASVR